ncbi:MAG: rubrerythrin family protein [Clostridiales bacterium]|nr:rubrerythrin family protein [Clostridiales bacterium]
MDNRTPPLTVSRVPQPEQPVADSAPYPPLETEGPNRQYARILMTDLASRHSEMSSITQYLYQSWTLEKEFASIAETLSRIARVEMHHLNMLGQLILLLGGDPRLICPRGRRLVPWNGAMPFYGRQIKPMLQSSLQEETGAVDGYLRQSHLIRDEKVSCVLQRIALDEQLHVRILQGYLDTL